MDHPHLAFAPSAGAVQPARSWIASDAPRIDLAGAWQFRLSAGVPGTPGAYGVLGDEAPTAFAAPDYDASRWDLLPVPSHWVLADGFRFGTPSYTNVQYPFPVDPPFVPDENPTGDYRRTVEIPQTWLDSGQILLRFDGVESFAQVWLNGNLIGSFSGSRLAHELNVTNAAVPGMNTIAVRVTQWSAASYLEDQDQWWLPGIFRDVALLHRPIGAIEDVWIHADYDPATQSGELIPDIRASESAYPIQITLAELNLDLTWSTPAAVQPVRIDQVQPWSPEEPTLYHVRIASAGETLSLRTGFRRVEIDGDRFLVNGRQVTFSGVNRHEIRSEHGRVFDEEFARADLVLMKQHNVNAVRTSHYPPHPRLLDLLDELGFWVMLEADIETHGFEQGGWVNNPSDDRRWRAAYLDRIQRTVERDKNHPSIVMWSLGNESHTGSNLAAAAQWVHGRDPSRPVHYEGDYAGAYTDVYSRMYLSYPELASIASNDDVRPLHQASTGESARQRSKPFVHCEYAHAMGNGPGGLLRYREQVDAHQRLHGGFVWEWRDHGLRHQTTEGTAYFAYGGDFGEVVHDGNFVMDGLVRSDGTPTPGLLEFHAVEAPLVLTRSGVGSATVWNRRFVADTGDLELRWSIENDGHIVEQGTVPVANNGEPLSAGATATVALFNELPAANPGQEQTVTLAVVLSQGTAWAPAGHVLARAQWAENPAGTFGATRRSAAGAPVPMAEAPAAWEGPALVSLAGAPIRGPHVELWRAPTDNDYGRAILYDETDPHTLTPALGGHTTNAQQWLADGLDRLTRRVVDFTPSPEGLLVTERIGAAQSRAALDFTQRWSAERAADGAIEALLHVTIAPNTQWRHVWPRLGLHFTLPTDVDGATWFGYGPHPAYPDSRSAVWLGRHSARIEELDVHYARPQESGHRAGLRELVLHRGGQPWLQVSALADAQGRRPGFTLSRHSAHELGAAAHPHELPTPAVHHLYVDAAQQGLGSASCGPDVWPDAILRPQARTLTLRFRAR